MVDFDGFYLESDPCLVCNNPEVPYGSNKLSAIKSDARFSTTCQMVKLVSSYDISRVLLRISDVKRQKMVSAYKLGKYCPGILFVDLLVLGLQIFCLGRIRPLAYTLKRLLAFLYCLLFSRESRTT